MRFNSALKGLIEMFLQVCDKVFELIIVIPHFSALLHNFSAGRKVKNSWLLILIPLCRLQPQMIETMKLSCSEYFITCTKVWECVTGVTNDS
jgi:hypothetical protein